jgi:hypothetical protein
MVIWNSSAFALMYCPDYIILQTADIAMEKAVKRRFQAVGKLRLASLGREKAGRQD